MDASIFLNFFENFPLKKKVYPLAIFFNNQFFSYNFFFNYVKNLKLPLENNDKNKKLIKSNFISTVSQSNVSLVLSLNKPLENLITVLTYLKNNNKNI